MSVISLSRIIAHWAAIQPDTIAISHEAQTITWRALELETNQLARAYADQGVTPNSFVTIALPNGL